MNKYLARTIAWVITAAITWVALTAAFSFIYLDWRMITDTGTGRAIYVIFMVWWFITWLTQKDKDAD